MTLSYILLANFLISLGGLLGFFSLIIKEKTLQKYLKFIVAISAGAMMGNAFLHLLPEASESIPADQLFPLLLLTFVVFLTFEKLLFWRHCHDEECDIHAFGYLNLIGDALHNFIDGMLIAGAFLINPNLGIATTVAVALHEIPQEIGDFSVLLYAGFKRTRALILNFLIAAMSILGGFVGFFLAGQIEGLTPYLLVMAAGSFLYVSAADLIPEMRNQKKPINLLLSLIAFILGISLIWALNRGDNHTHLHSDHENEHVESVIDDHDHSEEKSEEMPSDDDHDGHEEHEEEDLHHDH